MPNTYVPPLFFEEKAGDNKKAFSKGTKSSTQTPDRVPRTIFNINIIIGTNETECFLYCFIDYYLFF